MKNLRKALAAVIALTVMSVSATAFAEVSATGAFSGGNNAVTADYSEIAQNKVKATVDTTLATTGTQMTFLVLDDGTDVTNIGESDILYIDQKELTAGGNTFTGVINLARVSGAAVDATEIPAGSYPIRVGYYYDDNGVQTFGLAAATMVVTAGSTGTTITILWGDITSDGYVTAADALEVAYYNLGLPNTIAVKDTSDNAVGSVVVGNTIAGLLWGDLTSDGYVTAADALEVAYYNLGLPNTIAVKDTSGSAVGSVVVGGTIDVTYND